MRLGKALPVAGLLIMLSVAVGLGENIDPYEDGSQFAYGENVGWLNFEANEGPGVTVSGDKVSGFVWAENIGWINLSPVYGGVLNDGGGLLSGHAWGENVGWINFNPIVSGDPTRYGVSIDEFGEFSGWAWGENIGWINFNSADLFGQGVRACKASFDDLANLADDWLSLDPASPGDLIGPSGVNERDFAAFAWYWRDFCPDGWRLK